MKFGQRIAFKRLSPVEVDLSASNQHELHAGSLRRELGFGPGRITGEIRVARYSSLGPALPQVMSGSFTLYDARDAHPTRSEWRLYYDIPGFGGADAGDLLVLFRDAEATLGAIVAAAGSEAERMLVRHLAGAETIDLDRLVFVDSPHLDAENADGLVLVLAPTPPTGTHYPDLVREIIDKAVVQGEFPNTAEMADIAATSVERAHGEVPPDLALFHGLEAETDIYFEMEESIYGPAHERLQRSGADLTAVTSFVLSIVQSRRSRRGQSLQHHFARVLDASSVPHSEQCRTEPGERPDFILPGCSNYHDDRYPAARLRLVACKTTARERWRQVLNEGARVRSKYLLTVDTGLTEPTLGAMQSSALRVFMPAPIITSSYPQMARSIGTVQELIDDLRAA